MERISSLIQCNYGEDPSIFEELVAEGKFQEIFSKNDLLPSYYKIEKHFEIYFDFQTKENHMMGSKHYLILVINT